MKKCELCMSPARAYCGADLAHLCWDCDGRVHGANFLVERHTRNLLCYVCHSLTAWTACGSSLGRHTVTLCDDCAQRRRIRSGNDISAAGNGESQILVDSVTTAAFSDEAPPDPSTGPSTSSSSSTCASSSFVKRSSKRSRNLASALLYQCNGTRRSNAHGSSHQEEDKSFTQLRTTSATRNQEELVHKKSRPLLFSSTTC